MQNRTYIVTVTFAIFLVIVANLGLYLTHGFPMSDLADGMMRDALFNADTLELPALYRDVVTNGGSFSQWYWTPTPYFFPDMPLYYLCEKLTADYYYAVALYFTLESLFLIWVTSLFYRLFFSVKTAWILTAIIMLMLYLFRTPTYSLQFISTFHYSEFLIGFISLYLVVRILKFEENKPWLFMLLTVLFVLMVTSDRLFVLHFLLPLIVSSMIWLYMHKQHWERVLLLIVVALSSIFLGEWLQTLFIPHEIIYPNVAHPHLELAMLKKNIPLLKEIWQYAATYHRMNLLLVCLGLLSFIFYSIRYMQVILKKRNEDISVKIALFVALFILFMTSGTLMAMALTTNEVASRHMIPIFMLAIIFLPLYLIRIFTLNRSKNMNTYLNIVLGIFIVTMFWQLRKDFMHKTVYTNYTTPVSECLDNFLDETGSKSGVSPYWESKRYFMLSKHQISIAQVYGNTLKPYKWVTTLDWYKNRYDFALTNHNEKYNYYRLDTEKIIEINGAPTKTVHCGNTDILYYKNGMSLDKN